ncbi:hypothetical protein [Flavobacterium beibuense]|uniref:Uncharacterized protein n=1 Tax=Flavobacterium beibuense TaxID=657326 RepID=A0A444WDA8_9FLAO|nr:hypothetical protein [Flavobacterium beibuense]RYJ43744.1 hypothetical protein NU09_1252 [Flavobacterium beibuense]
MRQFRIQYFLISFLAIVLLPSCAVKTVSGFKEIKKEGVYEVSYFSDKATDYVYKAHISIYGKDFGGIFIAKKINDSIYRTAFTTEFGNKLFDFEISDNSFKVNYILEEMDKKIIVNTLKRDFMLLLKQEHSYDNKYESSGFEVYKSEDNKRYNYLFLDAESNRLVKLVNATKGKEKIEIIYVPESSILARNIVIDHKNIKLKIELNFIQ